ncbi:MAG: flagellar motor stator protein MotA [Nitrospirae bacterium]|nr:flagellar motor stator protein MotA [Nitrospirota bacterium]
MFVIIGILVVMGAVVGGYLMEHGNLSVLFQPAELVIIFGASIGSLIIAAPPKVLSLILKSFGKLFSSGGMGKSGYLELLGLLYKIFSKIRKEGLISIEADIENPGSSPLFLEYRAVMSNHHAVSFLCDNLKVIISTNVPPYELDNLMELETDTHHHEALIPAHNIAMVADALPGLGIVAAVLGVVLTMGKINEPPEVLGQSIGAALVGTFLGVLMCYGFVGPIATNLEAKVKEDGVSFQIIRIALVAFVGGSAPQMAVEFGRRAIPTSDRPSFNELEETVRKK